MWTFILSALTACTPAGTPGVDHDLLGQERAAALVMAPAGAGGLGSAWIVGAEAPQVLSLDGGIQDLFWAGDVNGDGRWELLVQQGTQLHLARVGEGGIELLGPSAAGEFATHGDVNGDGRSDVLFLGPAGVMLALSGDLSRAVALETPSGLMQMVSGDLDGDGREEWVALELQQGPTGVQAVLLARPGNRGGLGDSVDHPLPPGQVPAWMRILELDGQARVVLGMADGPVAFSFQGGKLRPEPAVGLPTVAARDLQIWQGQALTWREDGVFLGEQRLQAPSPDSGMLLRDLDADGTPELVWASRTHGHVGILQADGTHNLIQAPAESAPFPPGRLILGPDGQVFVQWRGRLFSESGELSWEEAPVAPVSADPTPRHRDTDWGSLDWSPAGEVTFTDSAGQTRDVLHGLGNAMDIAVQGNQGVALGVHQGALAWFRFEMGPEGPGLAQAQPAPMGGLSFFGAVLR